MKCTWVDCQNDACYPQVGSDQVQWANLCEAHHREVEAASFSSPFDAKVMLRCWVRAMGGAKAAAKRMVGEEYD